MNILFNRILLTASIVPVLAVSSMPYVVIANSETEDDLLKSNIDAAVEILEKSLKIQYENLEESVKKEIKEKGYDYELTMMTFYDQGNPFKSADYTKILAAYATAKQFNSQGGVSVKNMLLDCQFLDYEIEESIYDEETTYGEVKLSIKDPEYIFDFFDISLDDEIDGKTVAEVYETKQRKIDDAIYEVELSESMFVLTKGNVQKNTLESLITDYYNTSNVLTNDTRKLIYTALTLQGQVPYEWGGKASKPGYDNSWWTYNESGNQKGLDCSGYVQWAFMTAGFSKSITDKLISTKTTVDNFPHITKEDLKPGDLGLFNNGTLATNHVGIYLGEGYWIHCSSSAGTVIIAKDVGFNVFVRVLGELPENNSYSSDCKEDDTEDIEILEETEEAEETDTNIESETNNENNNETSEEYLTDDTVSDDLDEESENEEENESSVTEETEELYPGYLNLIDEINSSEIEYSEEDVYLLAKTMQHEALNQGVNGWVAVGEVIMNRVKSDLYPNTIREVVYQNGQFSANEEIAGIIPKDEMVDIARQIIQGNISVLQNENVLYFRNPYICKAEPTADWGSKKFYTQIGEHSFYLQ